LKNVLPRQGEEERGKGDYTTATKEQLSPWKEGIPDLELRSIKGSRRKKRGEVLI